MKSSTAQNAGNSENPPAFRRRQRPSKRGAALLIVLSLLALILLLALMTLRTGGDHATKEHFLIDSLEADDLTHLPLNIVLSQIKAGSVDLPPGTVWTSQPGMIRTFRAARKPEETPPEVLMYHRLYSAAVMSSAGFDAAGEAEALNGWNEKPSAFTDLNAPVLTGSKGLTELVYPIADPVWLGLTDGFALRSAAPSATLRQPLPLPVAWIYVLQDGQLVMPVSCDGQSAAFDEHQVTGRNPIVARVAFWTDDESSKLNLNTASEPEPWDMPAANTLTERRYAENPPTAAEAYRLSTHPAYTGLSVVLRHFGGGAPGMIQWPPETVSGESFHERYSAFYQSLVPDGVLHSAEGIITSKNERLFASPEEFYYAPQRHPNGLASGFRMTQEDLRRSRFLLTTHPSAPELNPWGQPKIALWMMPRDSEARSLADRRMNACSMLPGGQEFIFQRADNWRSPADPGSSQSMTADWEGVPRNRELYSWLQTMTDQPVPGYTKSFLEKYGNRNRDQILTSMLDMLRWSTNPASYLPPPAGPNNPQGLAQESAFPLTLGNKDGTTGTRGFGRFPTTTEVAIVFAFTDVEREANGLPSDVNKDGICDRATKLRAFMVVNPFIAAGGTPAVSPAFSLRLRRLQHFTIGQGIGLLLPGGNARNRCTFSGPALFSGAENSAFNCFASQFLQADGQPKEMGNRDDPARGFPFISSNDVRLPEDCGQPGSSIRFSGGAIIVDFMEPGAPLISPKSDDSIHSVEMEFPDKAIPLPALTVADFVDGPRSLDNRFAPVSTADGPRLSVIRKGDVVRSMVLNVRGPSQGDARIVAAKREVLFASDASNRNLFAPHPDYDSLTVMQAHSLKEGIVAQGRSGGPVDNFPAAGSSPANAASDVPHFAEGAVLAPMGTEPGGRQGDWESGAGRLGDGPGVNRSARQPMASLIRNGRLQDQPAPPFSPIKFGAIPSGIYGDAADATPRPWRTLLFCPNPADQPVGSSTPSGFAPPPDHLWLEFFWNPVVEPRPLSAGFATEGKVNLNFQILPWTWLRRSTALHGALQGVQVTAIPAGAVTGETGSAKGNPDGSPAARQFRYAVDAGKTLAAFERRFDNGGVFRYPSEICGMFLVPKRLSDSTYDGPDGSPANPENVDPGNLTAWWNGQPENPADAFEATGDNLRESPYAQLYSRVCTQSNVFRMHYKVQVLKKVPGSPPSTWQESRDVMVSERRGSYGIERRFAPADAVADPATHPDLPSLHTRHQLVITGHQRFRP